MLRADPERGAEPRLTSFRQLVQVEDGLVKGLQEGVLVIAENLVPVLIQQVQPGHPLILGEHVGQNVLLEPLLVSGLIIRMELSQKPGGLSQDLHIPELLGEVEGQILGHRPGRDQKVLLLLGDHHLCVCVIGVIDRKQQGAQQAGQQSRNQHLGRFPPSESHHAPPPFLQNIIPRRSTEKNIIFLLIAAQAGPESPSPACEARSLVTVSKETDFFFPSHFHRPSPSL